MLVVINPVETIVMFFFSDLGCGILVEEISRNELAWKINGLLSIFIPPNSHFVKNCKMLWKALFSGPKVLQKFCHSEKGISHFFSVYYFQKGKIFTSLCSSFNEFFTFLRNFFVNCLNLCFLNRVTVKSLAVWSLMFQQLLSRLLLVVVLATLLEMTKFCAKVWNLILFIVKIGQRMLIHQMQSDANWWHSSYVQSLLQASW